MKKFEFSNRQWDALVKMRDGLYAKTSAPIVSKNVDTFGCKASVHTVRPWFGISDHDGKFFMDLEMITSGGICNNSIRIPYADIPSVIEAIQNTYNELKPYVDKADKWANSNSKEEFVID